MSGRMQNMSARHLQEAVLREIEWDPQITSTDINAAADDGVVTLTGFTHSYLEKTAAEKAVKRAHGVRAIANDIAVKPGLERTDPEIARDAVQALKAQMGVPDDEITVTVGDGWLTLEGVVDWQYQKNCAESAIKFLSGIKGFVNQIVVKATLSHEPKQTRVEDELRHNAEVEGRRIAAESNDKTVKLRDIVRSWADREEAARAAWSASGRLES
jgi:osmotically-inducible protein OsmY